MNSLIDLDVIEVPYTSSFLSKFRWVELIIEYIASSLTLSHSEKLNSRSYIQLIEFTYLLIPYDVTDVALTSNTYKLVVYYDVDSATNIASPI